MCCAGLGGRLGAVRRCLRRCCAGLRGSLILFRAVIRGSLPAGQRLEGRFHNLAGRLLHVVIIAAIRRGELHLIDGHTVLRALLHFQRKHVILRNARMGEGRFPGGLFPDICRGALCAGNQGKGCRAGQRKGDELIAKETRLMGSILFHTCFLSFLFVKWFVP